MEIYNIIEIANTHGGDVDYMDSLLKEFAPFKKGFGIKFQPFKYDKISTKDYPDYKKYERFFIEKDSWKKKSVRRKRQKMFGSIFLTIIPLRY